MKNWNLKKIGLWAFLVLYFLGCLFGFIIYIGYIAQDPQQVVIIGLMLGFGSLLSGYVFYWLSKKSDKGKNKKLDLIIEKLNANHVILSSNQINRYHFDVREPLDECAEQKVVLCIHLGKEETIKLINSLQDKLEKKNFYTDDKPYISQEIMGVNLEPENEDNKE